jgi:hypothetical protein
VGLLQEHDLEQKRLQKAEHEMREYENYRKGHEEYADKRKMHEAWEEEQKNANLWEAKMRSTGEMWNLSAFGMTVTKPVSYSLLVHEAEHTQKSLGYGTKWMWSTSSVHDQTQLFKVAILLTAVMLNLTMHNRYVSDVNFWSVVFLVVAYGVLDAAVRRASELVMAVELMHEYSVKSNIIFMLGYLLKLGVAVVGLIYIYYETYQSPVINSYWVKSVNSGRVSGFEMEDDRRVDQQSSENWVLYFTMGLWVLLVFLDTFRDWSLFVSEHSTNRVKLVLSTASNQESKSYQLLVQSLLFVYFFACLYALFFNGMLSSWKEHPELSSSKLTMYEWHRNNWLYGVGQPHTYRG